MKGIIVYIGIFILSMFCFSKAEGQAVEPFGAGADEDTSKTWGQLVVVPLANDDSNKVLSTDASGHVIFRTKTNVDLSGYLQKSDTSRSGIVTTYWYVDSLVAAINPTPDSSVFVTTTRLNDSTESIRNDLRTNSVIGEIYNENAWANTDTFTANFANFSIVDSNIKFPATGSAAQRVLSLDLKSGLDRWDMSARVILDTNVIQQFGLGMFGDACFASNLYVDYWRHTGKLYVRAVTNTALDSSTYGMPAILGDTLMMRVWFFYDDLVLRGYIYNRRSDSAIMVEYSAGEAEVKGQSNTTMLVSSGRYSVFANGGGFTLDSLFVTSNTIKNPDLVLIGNSKTAGARPTDMHYSWARRLMDYYANSVMMAGSGNCINDLTELLPMIGRVNPKQILIDIGYNDYFSGLSTDSIIARYGRFVDGVTALGIRAIHLLPQYDNRDQSALRAYIIANYDEADIIDVYAQTAALGNAGLADGVHPNDTGHTVILLGILNSGKIWGEVSNNVSRQTHTIDNKVVRYDITVPSQINGLQGAGSQTILKLYNPNSSSDAAMDWAVSGNTSVRSRQKVSYSGNSAYYRNYLSSNGTFRYLGQWRGDIGGLAINDDTTLAHPATFWPSVKLMVGGAIGLYGKPSDVVDTVFVLGLSNNYNIWPHLVTKVLSSTPANNYLRFQQHTGVGNFTLTTGIYFGVSSTGTDRLGIGIAPTEALHVNGSRIRLGDVYIITGTGSPEGATTATVGSLYLRSDGGTNTTMYRKESGTGNTGWVAVEN